MKIDKILESINIAEDLDEQEVQVIGSKVKEELEEDIASRTEWKKQADEIMKLAKLTIEPKNSPNPNSSNVKIPIITTAVLQYAARLFPEIIRNNSVVGATITGLDPDGSEAARAKRISKYMNYQLLVQKGTDWIEQMDRLLIVMLTIGVGWKKIYYNPIKKRNCSEFVTYTDLIINDCINSIDEAPRISHLMKMTSNQIMEKINLGIFCKIDSDNTLIENRKQLDAMLTADNHYHDIVEQHRFLDLDEDGYDEPYIVTILKDSGQVLRIVARFDKEGMTHKLVNNKLKLVSIKPIQYFEDFHCIRSPDGKYHSYGLGTFLLHGNKAANTLLNILIDAGKNSSLQTLIIGDNVKMPGGNATQIVPGSILQAKALDGQDLSKSVVPLLFPEPSPVLQQSLELMLNYNEKLGSVTDINTGNQDAQNVNNFVLSELKEAGQVVFSAIQRRIISALKSEFEKLYRLNSIYMNDVEYFKVLNDRQAIMRQDFNSDQVEVRPVSDPNLSDTTGNMMKSNVLLQMLQNKIPMLEVPEILKRIFETMEIENPEKLISQPQPPQPDPKLLAVQANSQKHQMDAQIKAQALQIKQGDLQVKAAKTHADIQNLAASTQEKLANAKAITDGTKLDIFKTHLDHQNESVTLAHKAHELDIKHQIEMEKLDNEESKRD